MPRTWPVIQKIQRVAHPTPPPEGLEAWLLDWHSSTDLSNGHPCDGAGAKANFMAQKCSPGDWFTKTFGVLP